MSSLINVNGTPEKEKKMTTNMKGLEGLFGKPIDVESSQGEPYVVWLPASAFCERKDHKWKPLSGEQEKIIEESIGKYGILEALVARPKSDVPYNISADYELLAGHNRIRLGLRKGIELFPTVIKHGLTESQAEQIVNHTNMGRSWSDMSYSNRAAVLASEYDAAKEEGSNKEFLEGVNFLLNDGENLEKSMAEDGLFPGETKTVREMAEENHLSYTTISRYVRINTLIDEIKELLDAGKIQFKAAVQLSHLEHENQEIIATVIKEQNIKCNETQANMLRKLQKEDKLNLVTITDVLSGKKRTRKAGRSKDYKISSKVVKKYFPDEEDSKKIEEIIEAALEQYFGQN